jgi:uncharacterized membrane protein
MKILASIAGFIFIVVVVLSVIAPSEYKISREILINKPAAQVFMFAKTMQNAPLWNAWLKLDPNIKIEYVKGNDGEVGFISTWESSHPEVGVAEQEITKLQDNTRIDTEIRFKKPFEASFNSYVITEAQNPQQTKVTMGMHDDMGFPMYVISFVMCLVTDQQEKMNQHMDASLNSLKQILEAGN